MCMASLTSEHRASCALHHHASAVCSNNVAWWYSSFWKISYCICSMHHCAPPTLRYTSWCRMRVHVISILLCLCRPGIKPLSLSDAVPTVLMLCRTSYTMSRHIRTPWLRCKVHTTSTAILCWFLNFFYQHADPLFLLMKYITVLCAHAPCSNIALSNLSPCLNPDIIGNLSCCMLSIYACAALLLALSLNTVHLISVLLLKLGEGSSKCISVCLAGIRYGNCVASFLCFMYWCRQGQSVVAPSISCYRSSIKTLSFVPRKNALTITNRS